MARKLTRKDFLIFGAASAGTAFVAAACSSDSSNGGGAGSPGTAGQGPAGSPGSGGSTGGTAGGGVAGSGTGGTGGGVAGAPAGGAAGSTGGLPKGGAAGSTGGSGGKSGGAGAGGSGGKASGGSGGMSGGGGAGGGMCTADVVAKISCPHSPPHMLTITKADIDAAVADKVFTLSQAAGHTHTITMTAADWTTLKSGGTVFKFTEAGANQDHCVVLKCGTVDASTAAGAKCGGTSPTDGNDVACTTPWP